MTITTFQLFGERCSGTNYAEQLLIENFPNLVSTNDFGTKHRYHINTDKKTDHCLFIIVYRDIFDWLRSYYLKPYHVAPELLNIPFSDFIQKEWREVYTKSSNMTPDNPLWGKEIICARDPITGERFSNVVKLRNAKIRNWESLNNNIKHFYRIRYEDLRGNPNAILQDISDKFNLEKHRDFKNIETYRSTRKTKYSLKKYALLLPNDLDFMITQRLVWTF